MKRIVVALMALVFVVAASPADVAPNLETQGYYIEDGADASASSIGAAVSDARSAGGKLFVVVLASEPAGGATVFAENALDEVGGIGTVYTVAPETVGWASEGDIYTRDELDAATDKSLDGRSDSEVVTLFVEALTDAPGSGGLPWGWIFLVLIVGGIGFLIWRGSRNAKHAQGEVLEEARTEVQKRLNDVANDIIDLEAEVGVSEDATARQHYQDATAAYSRTSEEFGRTFDANALMDLAFDLDIAIWNLDSAEALLDGETPPQKPEKPAPTTPPPERVEVLPVPPRRPQRRSTPDTSAMMQALLAAAAMSAGRSSRRAGGSSRAPTSTRSTTTRMRGGGRRRR